MMYFWLAIINILEVIIAVLMSVFLFAVAWYIRSLSYKIRCKYYQYESRKNFINLCVIKQEILDIIKDKKKYPLLFINNTINYNEYLEYLDDILHVGNATGIYRKPTLAKEYFNKGIYYNLGIKKEDNE